MSREFEVQILTPAATLFKGEATEVVLPSYDGEVGVLAGHSDFVGILGTGPLKLVTNGDDYWFVLSSGAYRVESGKLTILAEFGERPQKGVDIEELSARLRELDVQLADIKNFSAEEFPKIKEQADQLRARIEVHRRTEVVN